MTEFYFNLSKNVAFGAEDGKATKPKKQTDESNIRKFDEIPPSKVNPREDNEGEPSTSAGGSKERSESVEQKPVQDSLKQEVLNESRNQESGTEGVAAQPQTDHHKRNQDALAAAKERFLARKKTKVNV